MLFTVDEPVVVPGHGIGIVTTIGPIAGYPGDFLTIDNPAWTLNKPVNHAMRDGIRHLSSVALLHKAFIMLTKKRRPIPGKNGHQKTSTVEGWLREGSVHSLAVCIRDLYVPKDEEIPETRRVAYEKALGRLAEEAALVLERPAMGMPGLIESTVIQRKIPDGLFS